MWLAIRNRCWTADRLQKGGLPHPECCPLCDQEEQTAQHILTSCVFAGQFWCAVLQPLNLVRLTPTRTVSFADWWMRAEKKLLKQHRKGFNTYCILGAWTSGNIGMLAFFPDLQAPVQAFKDKANLWKLVGAKRLSSLCLELGGNQVYVLGFPWSGPEFLVIL